MVILKKTKILTGVGIIILLFAVLWRLWNV